MVWCGYLEHVLYDEIGLSHHTEESHVSPGKERELAEVVLLHQRQDEPHEPWDTDRLYRKLYDIRLKLIPMMYMEKDISL